MTVSGTPPAEDGARFAADAGSIRRRSVPGWLLASAVLATAAGMAAATFRGDGTAINAFLFMSCEIPHVLAGRIERAVMLAMLGAAFAALYWRRWPVLLPVAAYILTEAVCRYQQGGQLFSNWAPLAHAARYMTPLALLLLAAAARGSGAGRWKAAGGEWILRIALGIVFAVHGLECIEGNPNFIDLILSSGRNLAGIRIAESAAVGLLEWIGIVDLVVATALLLRPHPAVLGWAAFWGAVTALSRVTANGWSAYPDVLVRSSHVLGPLALLWLVRGRSSVQTTPAGSPLATASTSNA